MVVVRFLFGAGEAGAYPNIARAIYNWFPRQRWEVAQGYIWMSGRIAGGITPLVWAILVSGTGFTPLRSCPGAVRFSCSAAWACFGALAFARWFRDRPADHASANAAERELIGSTWQPHSHSRGSLSARCSPIAACGRSALMYSLLNYGWFFNISYLPGYLKDRFALADEDLLGAVYTGAPLWVGAIGCVAGGFIVNALAHRLGDRRRARQVVGCGAMLVCATAWWGVYQATSLHAFCLLISLAAFCVDLTLGAAWATCQDLGRKHAAVTAACMNTSGTMGAALAAWLTGAIVEHYVAVQAEPSQPATLFATDQQTASMAGYQAVFCTYAAVYVVAALCWCFINSAQPLTEPEEEPGAAG